MSSRAVTGMSRPFQLTEAAGWARRLWVQAGWPGRPKLEPISTQVLPSSSGMQASGVRRGRPVLAPVEVRITPGRSWALSRILPPVSRCTFRSSAGTTCGATLANSRVEDTLWTSRTTIAAAIRRPPPRP
ncbi:hypothetical protein ADK77_37710 [Streptomyces antibioticus]|nr:hypothetical protein ADK77_37710 [Streptomyces antibioticus]